MRLIAPQLTEGLSLLAAVVAALGWRATRRRLRESVRQREEMANSSIVIEEERRLLELIAKGAPLHEVLDTLTRAIERISPGALCTVLLLDEVHRKRLLTASGPSLPELYMLAVNGLEIGPDVGACGSAAFRNETVIVEDIATDPRFAVGRDFVLSHGLRACWSQPIRDSRGDVLGTFAMYHRHVAKPRPEELWMVRAAAQLAGNAVERIRAEKTLTQTTKRLNLAERVARFGIWEADFSKTMMSISEGMAAMLERSGQPLELSAAEFEELVHPGDLQALRMSSDLSRAHGDTVQDEFRLVLPSGTFRWVRSLWRFEDCDGTPTRATGAIIDITEEKNMLARSQEARLAAEASAFAAREAERLEQDRKAILELVAKDRPLDQILASLANAVASHLPGSFCSVRIELPGESHVSLSPGFPERMARALGLITLGSIQQSYPPAPIARLSNDANWPQFVADRHGPPCLNYRAVPILHGKRPAGVIISFPAADQLPLAAEEQLLESWSQFASLAVERHGLYEQLSFRAQHDSLTALLNRAALYDRMEAQLRSGAAAMAVIYVDLDGFKEINDRYGHGVGDEVLQEVARRILGSLHRNDIAARVGGDEFVVLLPGVSGREEARRVADLMAASIVQPASFQGRELRLGASMGVSIWPDDAAHADGLLRLADEDMYRIKVKRRSPLPRRITVTEEPVSAPA